MQRTVDFHGQFVPNEPGEHSGVFIVSGEDPTGTVHEVEFPFFNIFVDGGFGGDDFMGGDWDGAWHDDGRGGISVGRPFPDDGGMFFFGDEYEEESSEMNWLLIAGIAGGAVLVLAVIVIVIIKKKKSKVNFDEDDI
jgi:hypothetical protein